MKLTKIEVTHMIQASPEAVFKRWMSTDQPGGLWFGVSRLIRNPVVDGLFYHVVEHEGRAWHHYGRFVQIEGPRFLQFTWVSEATRGMETIVTVTLEPDGPSTCVTLEQRGVPDDEMGRRHHEGWGWCLNVLAESLDEAV